MDYDKDIYSELAMKILDHDIKFWCSRYYIPGYDQEDLEQECRMRLWQQIAMFNPNQGVLIRSWAKQVIKNHLKNLLRNALRQKRGGNVQIVPLEGNVHFVIQDFSQDLDELLDKFHEKGMDLPDFY